MSKHREHREADIDQDRCPECGGELDTGWECNRCGFDAIGERFVDPDKNRNAKGGNDVEA